VGEDPVAEPPASLVEAPEGQRSDDPVHGEPALLLEGAHRELDVVVVRRPARSRGVLGRSIAQKTDPREQTGDLGDGGTRVPEAEDCVHAATVAGTGQAM